MSQTWLAATPERFAARLAEAGGRACLTWNHQRGQVVASAPWLDPLAAWLGADPRDFQEHEGVFFAVGPETGALMLAVVHRTVRGQGAGGLGPTPTSRTVSVMACACRWA